MLMAALVSRSSTTPQNTQMCVRSERSLGGPCLPHCEHIWLVFLGLTLYTSRPAYAALLMTICTNCPSPLSKRLFDNPDLAAAPLDRYSPVTSSFFGLALLTRLVSCKSSNTI